MNDSFTEVTEQGWFSRIGDSIKGIVVGLILFVVGFPVLFWNEGNAVKEYKTLQEGQGAVISVASDTVDAANEGKLVHMSGRAETEETLEDKMFGITANAIRLSRSVDMYQWEEEKKTRTEEKAGGKKVTETTYSYKKTWSSRAINSSNFKNPEGHGNPGSLPFSSSSWSAKNVTVGAFNLNPKQIGDISRSEGVDAGDSFKVPASVEGKAQAHAGGIYVGADPSTPEVGDLRIKFSQTPQGDISLYAKQVGSTFEPFKAKTGKTLQRLQMGTHSADAMFAAAESERKIKLWIIRLVGFLLQFIGLCMVFKPLSVIGAVIPFIGRLIGAATGFISFLIAVVTSCITIAIAWIVYRPVLAITLLVVAVGAIVLLKVSGRKRAA